MFWLFVLKRILHGYLIWIIIMFNLSALFITVSDQTLTGLLEEQLRLEVRALEQSTPEELDAYKKTRRQQMRDLYHLDDPIISRIFFRGLSAVTFQFGNSTIIKSARGERDVYTIIREVIPNTLLLFGTAMFIRLLFGLLLGIRKAQRAGGALDKSTTVVTMTMYGMPTWWLAMIMIMIFCYIVPVFPSGGIVSVPPPEGAWASMLDVLYHMALPLLTLIVVRFWGTALITRNIVLSTLQEDFIMSARARGIPEYKVLFSHTLRTAAPPIVTIALLTMLRTVSGNLVFEGIFSWPGMGNLYWISIQQNDIPVLLGLLSMTTLIYVAGLALLDIIYGLLDPRIKVGSKR